MTTARDLAIWTLVHRGDSVGGRLGVWVYPTRDAALASGAGLAMQAGLDEDPKETALFASGRYVEVLDRSEQTLPNTHILRVQAAFL